MRRLILLIVMLCLLLMTSQAQEGQGLIRQGVINIARHGQSRLISTFSIPTSWTYDDSLPNVVFNPDEAERLLEDAGWVQVARRSIRECVNCGTARDGTRLSLSLGYFEGRAYNAVEAIVIQQQLRRIGIDISIYPTTLSDVSDQRFDMYTTNWGDNYPSTLNLELAVTPEADVLNSNRVWNITSYNNSDVTRLIHEAQTVAGCDLGERQAIYSEVERILQDDLPYIWLHSNTVTHAYNADIQNISIQINDALWNLDDWWVFDAP
ncbi:MAG: ABC transporter substrate-binding protein [Anaerolineae bacterium]|nr:ABC transporter substrate-binding protein [Anaerolineae bacterium]